MRGYSFIYYLGMLRSKGRLKSRYGKAFYREFRRHSTQILHRVIRRTPDIGDSIFAFNYAFVPAYIAWYKAAVQLEADQEEIQRILWLINEQIIRTLPGPIAKVFVTRYLHSLRKKAPLHQTLGEENRLHPYDFVLEFHDHSSDTFEIDVTRCGMRTLAADFDAHGMFPAICRVDYLMFSLMGAGFERSSTLGDGDGCCNCIYTIGGQCEWAPEKGFGNHR